MPAYPYVMSPEKIGPFFKKLGEIGVPSKFSLQTLKSLGFTSSNDARLANLVKFLGFTDQSGTPSGLWKDLRTTPRLAMANAIRSSYRDLFQHYSDANKRDDEALRTYFSANSSLGSATVSKMATTFKTVCALGDFENGTSEPSEQENPTGDRQPPASGRQNQAGRGRTNIPAEGMTVNINIQLQLPSDSSAETYERFFEAMRKHLLNQSDEPH